MQDCSWDKRAGMVFKAHGSRHFQIALCPGDTQLVFMGPLMTLSTILGVSHFKEKFGFKCLICE